MEQQTLIILAIIFVIIVALSQPVECDCTSEGAASAPAFSAYLKNKSIRKTTRKAAGKGSA
jgi:hypothetical protein